DPFFRKLRASRMAEAACLDFFAQAYRHSIALRHSSFFVLRPGRAAPLVELHRKPFCFVLRFSERPPAFLVVRPCDMTRSGAMARLAADADFCPARRKAIGGGIVVFLNAGRMALRTHEIPVLIKPGPVQDVVVPYVLVRIKMKPT